jgi:CDP-diacylglycerol--glycerol-3-phosphate 3-phosphatidyltransferase/cardiolipin synthase
VTFANQITLLRILLIPVFVTFAIYYAESAAAGVPEEWLRHAAVAAFLVAAASDAIDGWVARRFRQITDLGRILDPLADKALAVAAVLTLTLSSWPAPLPLWFVVVVLTRELFITAGFFVVHYVAGRVHIEPHWTGKLATVLMAVTVGTAMLRLDAWVRPVAAVAAVVTLVSGALYLASASRQVKAPGAGKQAGPAG